MGVELTQRRRRVVPALRVILVDVQLCRLQMTEREYSIRGIHDNSIMGDKVEV